MRQNGNGYPKIYLRDISVSSQCVTKNERDILVPSWCVTRNERDTSVSSHMLQKNEDFNMCGQIIHQTSTCKTKK